MVTVWDDMGKGMLVGRIRIGMRMEATTVLDTIRTYHSASVRSLGQRSLLRS